jgi:hypothetical protein
VTGRLIRMGGSLRILGHGYGLLRPLTVTSIV